eukprot:CAMPEP_0197020644 /NCGR_PEP_ID=MMETSP1384-20130603/1477_1 /TAXON_ID=29189 /ORGANISM="Ammonia sp." /LENGTH=566 /DNA_ID=CAMNT_0042448309 /DNA_START=26 /DNA_END=1726 /DNA_ORIENTATION=+
METPESTPPPPNSGPPPIYNPYVLNDRLHFPSFSDAFGDLLALEAENLRKAAPPLNRAAKKAALNTLFPPIPVRTDENVEWHQEELTQPTHTLPHTRRPPQQQAQHVQAAQDDDDDDSSVQLSNLMSPNPRARRRQLLSPSPDDVNAQLLSQSPMHFPIIMPDTPKSSSSNERQLEALCNEFFEHHQPILTPINKRKNPVRLYDPDKDHNVTVMLEKSDPPFQQEETHEVRFAELSVEASMICGLQSAPSSTNLLNLNNICLSFFADRSACQSALGSPHRSDKDGSNSKESKHGHGNLNHEMEFSININKHNASGFSDLMPLTPVAGTSGSRSSTAMSSSPDDSLKQLQAQMSSIKLNKTQRKTQHKENSFEIAADELLLEDDAVCTADGELVINTTLTDHATQTTDVLLFAQEDAPRIRYDGKLLSDILSQGSNSGIGIGSGSFVVGNANGSNHSLISEGNQHNGSFNMDLSSTRSRELSDSDDEDEDNDREDPHLQPLQLNVPATHDSNIRTHILQKKTRSRINLPSGERKKDTQATLKEYKRSKLAQNPNWTLWSPSPQPQQT